MEHVVCEAEFHQNQRLETAMTQKDKSLMEEFGITSESKIFYLYKQHSYENLTDAVNFAKSDAKDEKVNIPHDTAD